GRVLAEDVRARRTQPPADVSAMDGYAARAADLATIPATLTQIASIPAGGAYDGTLGAGECARIFTGAPLPKGADTIVIQENTEAGGARILIKEGAAKGRFVRPAGLDFKEGDVGLTAGRVLSARDVGLAAAMNVPWLSVRRRPRVAILPTGDEIVMPGEAIGPNQIVSSNGLALAAFVEAAGGEATLLGTAPDDARALRAIAQGARGADLLVTTGGASVGEHDLVRDALAEDGLVLDFWKVAMRPGKPLIFGHLHGVPVLGLPGNPVSTLVCALIFIRPAIEAMLGIVRPNAPATTAVLGADLAANDQRQDYLRARLTQGPDGRPVATPYAKQDSSMISLIAHSDCLVVRPPFAPAAKAGEAVEIIPLSGGIASI
ncbi:MAG: molybdopterin molybdotransferase MoeA, partial [Alphaproteobacteria bacterium]|nr:molybdopterin molybdotransferase MoeA [Alphaproteobacteria bacterium]